MTVFANMMEVSAKAQGCKIIAAFPDVCFTPPLTPATPPGVPIPYPNFGMDSDLASGSSTVKIGGKPISQENSSNYSKISGDEAGAAPKKGIITSKNMGKAYAQMWSMDVKADGKGVVRFGDIATTNHASTPPNPPPNSVIATASPPKNLDGSDCIVGEHGKKQPDCAEQEKKTGKPHQFHHVVPDRCYRYNRRKVKGRKTPKDIRQKRAPTHSQGICICLPSENHVGTKAGKKKGEIAVHQVLDDRLTDMGNDPKKITAASPAGCAKLDDVRDECAAALAKLVPKTISGECFDLAIEKMMEQTEPLKDTQVRAEKSLRNLTSDAKAVLRKK